MNRINFLKQLFLSGASVFLAQNATLKATKEVKDIYLNSPHIAGFQYYKGLELEKLLRENDVLVLKREPQNQHDFFAVEVFRDNAKLGYLPRTDNKLIARMMDQGLELKARIKNIDPDAHPYRRVKLRVFYEMG